MAWSVPRTWVALETPTAAIMNAHVRDNFDFLGGLKRNNTAISALAAGTAISPYTVGVVAGHDTSVSFSSSATPATVAMNTDLIDPDGFHDPVTNNSRLTVPTGMGGLYYIFFSGLFTQANNVDRGQTGCLILVNGSAIKEKNHATVTWQGTTQSRGACDNELVYQLSAGQYVEFQAWQANLGALSMTLNSYAATGGVGFRAGMWKLKD